ncbi:MAG: HIT family protein [Planctomycetota bacterium]
MTRPGEVQWLWAPWRSAYLRKASDRKAPRACFFCAYVPRKDRDRENLVVRRGRRCFLVMNRYPYTSGHLMAAPYAHKGDLALLTPAERSELFDLLLEAKDALVRVLSPDGFNIGINLGRAAGAGVPHHAHFHIVPRWSGDANFMATVGGTRVISQDLDALWEQLQTAFRKRR